MDAVKFIEERNRMCNSFPSGCEGCRINEAMSVPRECVCWVFDNPEKAVSIVEEWSAARPRKTRQSVFLEQWPDADIDANGVVAISPCSFLKEYRNDPTWEGKCHAPDITCDVCRREFWMQEAD